MKAYFEFNLPDDQEEWQIYDNAMNYYLALIELERFIREQTKYVQLTDEQSEKMEEVKNTFYEILTDNNINL